MAGVIFTLLIYNTRVLHQSALKILQNFYKTAILI
nr:MAG TPA: hypothetical protein [Caudoviricetes sp.]